MRQQQQVLTPVFKPRADLRLRMIAHEPVYVVMTVDGGRLDLQVDDLSAGGARLKVRKTHLDLFQVGQILGPSLLVLDLGLPIVHPVVKWKSDCAIGVEFLGATEKQKEMIFKFLFRVERKTVRYLN
jgi:c-di-GMP-binding flagellar brake protein YcgR